MDGTCPDSHAFPYGNGLFCCSVRKVDGDDETKKSLRFEDKYNVCRPDERIFCPALPHSACMDINKGMYRQAGAA